MRALRSVVDKNLRFELSRHDQELIPLKVKVLDYVDLKKHFIRFEVIDLKA